MGVIRRSGIPLGPMLDAESDNGVGVRAIDTLAVSFGIILANNDLCRGPLLLAHDHRLKVGQRVAAAIAGRWIRSWSRHETQPFPLKRHKL